MGDGFHAIESAETEGAMDGGPLCFFIAYQHGGKSLPKIAMIFFSRIQTGNQPQAPGTWTARPKKLCRGRPFLSHTGRPPRGCSLSRHPRGRVKLFSLSKLRPPALYISAKFPDSILIFLPFDSVQG